MKPIQIGYKQTKKYDAGKANPFEIYKENEVNEVTIDNKDTNSGTSSSSGKNNTSTSNKNESSESKGSLFDNGSTK